MKNSVFIFFTASLILTSCSGSFFLSNEDILELTDRQALPTQEEFPDDGAVILSENESVKLFLNNNYEINFTRAYHVSMLYFNDKAEEHLTHTIYLDEDRALTQFYARTVKPNGEILELRRSDLVPTTTEYSDEKSLKFTFKGVEPGARLEYYYSVTHSNPMFFDTWYIQQDIPKLYSRYAAEIPNIFFRYYDWVYQEHNTFLDPPSKIKNITASGTLDAGYVYFWEVRDIEALRSEPNMPAYADVGQYLYLGLKYKNWDELFGYYWKSLKPYFEETDDSGINELAASITKDAKNDEEKIELVFDYIRDNFRYKSGSIARGGYLPASLPVILQNKYGDCLDLTLLNACLLKAAGINAYPAVVKSTDYGLKAQNFITLSGFNHMVCYAQTEDDKEYWLDPSNTYCDAKELPARLEDAQAWVIFSDGKGQFKRLPQSEAKDNMILRNVEMYVEDDGALHGTVQVRYSGNENLQIRSKLSRKSESDIKKHFESYINANTSDIIIENLTYDDVEEKAEHFTMKFDFRRNQAGSKTNNLYIFKPGVFTIRDDLDRYRDEERRYGLVFESPYILKDFVTVRFNEDVYELENASKNITENKDFASFTMRPKYHGNGNIQYVREYNLENNIISSTEYELFRELEKAISAANDENIVLRIK